MTEGHKMRVLYSWVLTVIGLVIVQTAHGAQPPELCNAINFGDSVRDSEICSVFWRCIYNNWVRHDCPEGLQFEDFSDLCMWPEQVSCNNAPVTNCNLTPCLNGASCLFSGSSFFCSCLPGYSGSRCEVSTCDSQRPCVNGICTPSNIFPYYTCACSIGFTGVNCSISTSVCSTFPCQNGGTCFSTGTGVGYFCQCPFGFSGTNCELSSNVCAVNPPACVNGNRQVITGVCRCVCNTGFTGVDCSISISACNSFPCANGGSCSPSTSSIAGYICNCPASFTGTRCETPVCSTFPCQNGGSCFSTGTGVGYFCQCPFGFSGTNCELSSNVCAVNPPACVNGNLDPSTGVCRCVCNTGFTGVDCSISNCTYQCPADRLYVYPDTDDQRFFLQCFNGILSRYQCSEVNPGTTFYVPQTFECV